MKNTRFSQTMGFLIALGIAMLVGVGFAVLARAQQPVIPGSIIEDTRSGATIQNFLATPASSASVPIDISTATTTRLVEGQASKRVYVTAVDVVAAGTGNIQFVSGTGATCGTGTADVTGDYNLIAQAGFAKGMGSGAVWVLPLGASLCAVTSAAVGMAGSLAYAIY